LYATGYEPVVKIVKKEQILPALFQHDCPEFDIFIRMQHQDMNQNLLLSEYAERSFEENLMALAHAVDIAQIDMQIKIVGKYFPAFVPPDISNNYIKPVILDFLADAYELAGRLDESAKTRVFILEITDDENLLHRSASFFDRHSQYRLDEQKDIE
jgi:hypothetical protein